MVASRMFVCFYPLLCSLSYHSACIFGKYIMLSHNQIVSKNAVKQLKEQKINIKIIISIFVYLFI